MGILVAIAILGAVLLLMMSLQAHLLFPTHAVGPPGPLPNGSVEINVATFGGNTLHGIHIPAGTAAQKPKTLVLGFGGNAWNGADVAAYLHEIFPEADVIAFHYRGYRPSTGSPSAEALLTDAPRLLDFAVNRVKPDRTIIVGFSIGGGVAASLAKRRPLDGLILVTPFDSLKAAAADLYPWLPIGPFFEHELDTASYLKDAAAPVAMIAGEYDTLIRPARTQALRDQVPNLVFDRTIAGAGHNDIYHRSEFQQAMREARDAFSESSKRAEDPDKAG